jgi:hypothetical protein
MDIPRPLILHNQVHIVALGKNLTQFQRQLLHFQA